MNTTAKMIIVLSLITMLAGAILSAWDGTTKPLIEAYKLRELQKAITEVIPPYDSYIEVPAGELTLYVAKKDSSDEIIGVAVNAQGNGFQGKISMMVGLDPAINEITGLKILEQIETPGLGTKIVEDPSNKNDRFWFTNQFKKLQVSSGIEVVKNAQPSKPYEIQAITGATISSKAVAKIISDNIEVIKKNYNKN